MHEFSNAFSEFSNEVSHNTQSKPVLPRNTKIVEETQRVAPKNKERTQVENHLALERKSEVWHEGGGNWCTA